MTPEQEAVLRDIRRQLRFPEPAGLGEQEATLAGTVAAIRADSAALREQAEALRGQIVALRTEISELEATTADLAAELRGLLERRLPFPLSLLEGPAVALVGRLESLLPARPGELAAPHGAREHHP
ncbi:hypothetical protein [Nocardia harenae]|uniref:hypothetical protein n=1 Tax=Nocardia harenae TaxID=358707 RepID=UPI00082FDEF4|nr:hypothetical protein [Nocardia harenae]